MIPLILGSAITIQKNPGMTLDSVYLDCHPGRPGISGHGWSKEKEEPDCPQHPSLIVPSPSSSPCFILWPYEGDDHGGQVMLPFYKIWARELHDIGATKHQLSPGNSNHWRRRRLREPWGWRRKSCTKISKPWGAHFRRMSVPLRIRWGCMFQTPYTKTQKYSDVILDIICREKWRQFVKIPYQGIWRLSQEKCAKNVSTKTINLTVGQYAN